MKLHLPAALLACALSIAVVQAAQEQVTITETSVSKTYNADNNPGGSSVNAINNWEHAGAVQSTHITVEDGASISSVVGGIVIGPRDYKNHENLTEDTMDGGVTIDITGGTISGTVYGGNTLPQALPNADLPETGTLSDSGNYSQKLVESAEILGDKINVGSININISGGEIGTIGSNDEAIMGGGGRHCGTESTGGISVNISGGTINNLIYAGTNGGSTGYTELNISGGTIKADVYGGGRKSYGVVEGNTNVTISGGSVEGNVYAGGNEDTVKGDAIVTISGNATIDGIVSGGGMGNAIIEGKSLLNIGTAEESYSGKLTVADFDAVHIAAGSKVTLNAAAGATLSLGDVAITSSSDSIAEITLGATFSLSSLDFIVMLTDEQIAKGNISLDVAKLNTSDMLYALYLTGAITSPQYGPAFNTTVTVIDENGNVIESTGKVGGTFKGGTAVYTASIEIVPEPTTATLSLLALAGLAARRRRR